MAEPYGDDGDNHGTGDYGIDDVLKSSHDGGRRWLPRLMTAMVAVIAIGGFASVLVYAYNKGKEVGGTAIPPIIKAGPAPHKIRPENPGGMKIPHRDKGVYSQLAANSPPRKSTRKVERLLPVPETPVASPAPVKKVMPVRRKPKKIELPPEHPVAKFVPKPPPGAKPRQVANAAGATGHATDARPATAKKPSSAKSLAAIAPASGSSTRVQLVALRSEAAVLKAWTGFRKRHPDLLGRLTLTVQRRDLGSGKGVYYRLQAGPLATIAAASTLCSEIKKRKMGCIVVRR